MSSTLAPREVLSPTGDDRVAGPGQPLFGAIGPGQHDAEAGDLPRRRTAAADPPTALQGRQRLRIRRPNFQRLRIRQRFRRPLPP